MRGNGEDIHKLLKGERKMCVRECDFPYFLLSHYVGTGKRRKQKCVKYVGITPNNEKFGKGVILPATVEFRFPVKRYCPTTEELAKLVASFCFLYGDFFWEDFCERVRKHYKRMVECVSGSDDVREVDGDGNA